MKLETLTLAQCEQVRIWRNAEMQCWRTSQMLTPIMQREFYESLSDRNTDKRYFAIQKDKGLATCSERDIDFIGMGGINNIQWENSIGEITLIIDPEKRKDSNGEKAVDLLLDYAFNHLNLKTVCGECYLCNDAVKFWEAITEKYVGDTAELFNRKYFDGIYWDSLYFSINKNDFNKIYNSK